MAPDLNTVPPSPYNNRRVARALEPMAPPAVPFSSPAAVLSGQSSRDTSSSAVTGTNLSSGDNTGVGIGPGAHQTGPRGFFSLLIKCRPSSSSATSDGGGFTYATRERAGSCGEWKKPSFRATTPNSHPLRLIVSHESYRCSGSSPPPSRLIHRLPPLASQM